MRPYLHSDNNKINKETALDEKGMTVKGRGDTPNQHDVLTGTQHDGMALPGPPHHTIAEVNQPRLPRWVTFREAFR